jgi:hypothetical protein
MKIEIQQLAKVSSLMMSIMMFIDFIHLLFTEEEEDQTMEKELLSADTSLKILQLMVKHISIF